MTEEPQYPFDKFHGDPNAELDALAGYFDFHGGQDAADAELRAAESERCPVCSGYGDVHDHWTAPVCEGFSQPAPCPACGGTGKNPDLHLTEIVQSV